jgi:hypothetical protein
MRLLSTKFLILLAAFIVGTGGSLGWYFYHRSAPNQFIIPDARGDAIFFQGIDEVTNLAGLPKLRETALSPSDLEIRVWKGFGLAQLEGVLLNRTDGSWTARHVTEINRSGEKLAEVDHLDAPRSGWDSFLWEVDRQGLTSLSPSADEKCTISIIDGEAYVVEISQDGTYRNGIFTVGLKDCPVSRQMEKLGRYIGMQFDSGRDQCKTAEWFPCATYLHHKEEDQR